MMGEPAGPEGRSSRRRGLDAADVVALLGTAILGAGLWMWWPPGALMVVGGLLVILGVFGAWARARR